jgi:aminoglycoside phosphotransferase (APT) family kinase protein
MSTTTPARTTGRGAAAEHLVDALRRRVPAVDVLLDPDRSLATARAWAATHRPGDTVVEVRVGDVLYRADGTVTLRCAVRLRPGPDATLLVRVAPDGAVSAAPFPHDPDLPTLPQALDPVAMTAVLGRLVPGVGRQRGLARCRVQVVHHPREGACVLRYELFPGAAGAAELRHRVVYAKVSPDAEATRRAADALRAVGSAGVPAGRLRLPRLLGVDPALHLHLLDAVPGGALVPRERGADVPTVGVLAAGRALAALHAGHPRWPLEARRGDDLSRLRADLAVVARVWPAVAAEVSRAVAPAVRAAESSTPAPAVVCHGDLTPSQVLLHDTGTALLDLEGAAWGEPASDVGRFLAYLDARCALDAPAGTRPPSSPAGGVFVAAYADAGGAVGGDPAAFLARVGLYRATSLARMALSAARRLKDERLAVALHLLTGTDPRSPR